MATKKKSSRSWESAGLPDWCLEAVSSMGFSEPTPSQAAAIPLFLANSDVVVEAPTGSGKSLAFLIPLAVRILRRFGATEDTPATPIKRGHVAALVLAPTRELADQLHRVLLELIAFHPPSAAILPYVQKRQRPDVQAVGPVVGKRNKKKSGKAAGGEGEAVMGAGRARARAGGASAYALAANGLQIAGELDEASAAIPTNSRRPETKEPVLVPQLVVGGAASKPAADLACFVRQGSNILVGTPGRLAELLTSTAVNATASFEALVLDEADRLLDLGFAADLQRILAFVPKQRRTFLCSASVNDAIGELIKVNLRNPKRVVVRVQARQQKQDKLVASSTQNDSAASSAVEEKKTPASLINTYLVLPSSHKLPALVHLLDTIEPRPLRTLVFMASCFSVKYFSSVLPAALPPGYSLLSLHGKLEPHVREKAFARFLSSTSPCVLLTTDVASRGLDVPSVDLVISIDPPTDPKTFLHRCGRTGRAGRRGLAVTMLRPGREADDYVSFLAVRKTPVDPLASAVPALAARMPIEAAAEATAGALTQTMRSQVLADRELHQLSQRAFVSWARAFQEHQAGSIFRVADLDWVDLGHAWGLARLPKMPELRAIGLTDRSLGLGPDVRVDDIPFKDKVKEKRRLAEQQAARAAVAAAEMDPAAAAAAEASNTRKRNAAWSVKQDRDTLRTERREKKRRKRTAEQLALMTPEERAEYDRVEALVAEIRQKNVEAGWELDEEGRDVVVSKKKYGAVTVTAASTDSKKASKEESLDDSFDGFDD